MSGVLFFLLSVGGRLRNDLVVNNTTQTTHQHKKTGMFTPRAELTNGRAAMLAFAVLLALEQRAGVPFF